MSAILKCLFLPYRLKYCQVQQYFQKSLFQGGLKTEVVWTLPKYNSIAIQLVIPDILQYHLRINKKQNRHITYFLWILYEYALHLHIKLLFLLPQVAIFVHFEIIFILDSCLFLRLLHFSFLQPYSTFLFWQSRQIYRHLSKHMNKIKLKTTHQLT